MRKVVFIKWWKDRNGNWKSFQSRGTFHKWSTAMDYKCQPPREYVIGIVEDFKGIVHEIRPKNIQFKDFDIITNADIMEPLEAESEAIMNALRVILRTEHK